MAAQLAAYVLEPVDDEAAEPEHVELQPHPVIAVVAAARGSGTTTVARLLAAEHAVRAQGAAVVASPVASGRAAPPTRAAVRLATALRSFADARPSGRLCLVTTAEPERLADGARYLGPVVLVAPPDGSAAATARTADHVAIVTRAAGEPALAAAVALILGGRPLTVANRVVDGVAWARRADILLPESRVAARAALLGTRALGPLGTAISSLADALEHGR